MAPPGFQFLPRFYKPFISHFSSNSMEIPVSYHDHLPSRFPKTVTLQGPRGCSWKIKTEKRGDEVHFAKGWPKFVEDNNLADGDFLSFVYDGESIFEVSIYRTNGCKDTISDNEVEEDIVYPLTSEDTDTCSKSEIETTIPRGGDKGKSLVEFLEDSDDDDDKEESAYSWGSEETETETETETDTSSHYTRNKTIVKSKKKDDTANKQRVPNLKKKEAAKNRKKVHPKIANPEQYLDDPNNPHFETNVKKKRLIELVVPSQVVQDYCLRFGDCVDYIDEHGELTASTAKWENRGQALIKKWRVICERNALGKEDRVLCEFLRRNDYVYAIKLHIVRGCNL